MPPRITVISSNNHTSCSCTNKDDHQFPKCNRQ